MAIKSSHKEEKEQKRVVSPKEKEVDNNENSLRPKTLADYV
ncbi:MAG: hypothetical protein U9Q66_02125 [Patescibacteria group bacterium]|nr:hypothetical protein [Patescibacteria group bacterium]